MIRLMLNGWSLLEVVWNGISLINTTFQNKMIHMFRCTRDEGSRSMIDSVIVKERCLNCGGGI